MDIWEEKGRRGNSSVFTPHTPRPPPSPGDSDSEFILNILITNLEHFPAKIPKHGWFFLVVGSFS